MSSGPAVGWASSSRVRAMWATSTSWSWRSRSISGATSTDSPSSSSNSPSGPSVKVTCSLPGVGRARSSATLTAVIHVSDLAPTSDEYLLEDDGSVAETAPLGADPGVGAGTTELGAGHWDPPGEAWGDEESGAVAGLGELSHLARAVQRCPSRLPITIPDQTPILGITGTSTGQIGHPGNSGVGNFGRHVARRCAHSPSRAGTRGRGVDPVERHLPLDRLRCLGEIRVPAIESWVPLTKRIGTGCPGSGRCGAGRACRRRGADTTASPGPAPGAGHRHRRRPSSSSGRPSTARRGRADRAAASPAWRARPPPRGPTRRAPWADPARCGPRCGTGS